MYFGHKLVETGPNCSHELATFLKNQMTLMLQKNMLFTLRQNETEMLNFTFARENANVE